MISDSSISSAISDCIAAILSAETEIKAAKAEDGDLFRARRHVGQLTLLQYAHTIAAIARAGIVRQGKRDNNFSSPFRAALVGKNGMSAKKASRLWDYSQATLSSSDKRFARLKEATKSGADAVLAYLMGDAAVISEAALKRAVLPDATPVEFKIANQFFKKLSIDDRDLLLTKLAEAVKELPRDDATAGMARGLGKRAIAKPDRISLVQ